MYACFHKLETLVVAVLIMRALLHGGSLEPLIFGNSHIWSPPNLGGDGSTREKMLENVDCAAPSAIRSGEENGLGARAVSD